MPKYLRLASGVYVEESTVGSSAGAGDVGKVPHLDAAGKLSSTFLPSSAVPSRAVLGSDISSSATSLGDATGLSFSVSSGVRYRFAFWVVFRSAATTTGIKLSVNAPATTLLAYNVAIPISAIADVLGYRRAVNVETIGTGVDAITADLLATVEGVLVPSANGTLILRYASEVAASAVTIRAGSHGELVIAA